MATETSSAVTGTRENSFPVFAGSETMSFAVNDMPPGIKIYTYVNGVNITNFTQLMIKFYRL